jgi:sensor histidine kinase YesM
MLKHFILLFVLILPYSVFSQKEEVVDSVVKARVSHLAQEFGRLINKDLDSAGITSRRILEYATEHNFKAGIGMGHGTLGTFYTFKGDEGTGIAHYIKSVDIFEAIGNEHLATITNINIAALLTDQEEHKEALKYATKAHESEVKNKGYNLNSTYNLLGLIGVETGQPFEKVLHYFEKSEEYSRIQNDTVKLANAIQMQGYTYFKNDKDVTVAITKLEKALQLFKRHDIKNHNSLGVNFDLLSQAYLKKGLYNQALKYNDSSLIHYNTLDFNKGLRITYETRKEILANLGRYKEGFEAFEIFKKYNDSVFQKKRTNQIARLRTEFETEQITTQKETAEAQLELSKAISKQNKTLFIGAAVVALFILLASIFYLKRIKTRKKMELITIELNETQKRLALEKQYRDSELKALKAQMNPHFIFNALNSIQEYIILSQKNLAGDYLGKFADLMRKYLHHSDAGFITVQEEVESLKMYLELEALRFEDTLEYTFNVDKTIRTDEVKIPTMLVQPYIENALKHGLLHRVDNRKLSIFFNQESENSILCIIEDNGVGRKKAAAIKAQTSSLHKSFATKATENRLQLLNFGKERKIGVEIEDLLHVDGTAKGTKVTLEIPVLII